MDYWSHFSSSNTNGEFVEHTAIFYKAHNIGYLIITMHYFKNSCYDTWKAYVICYKHTELKYTFKNKLEGYSCYDRIPNREETELHSTVYAFIVHYIQNYPSLMADRSALLRSASDFSESTRSKYLFVTHDRLSIHFICVTQIILC